MMEICEAGLDAPSSTGLLYQWCCLYASTCMVLCVIVCYVGLVVLSINDGKLTAAPFISVEA